MKARVWIVMVGVLSLALAGGVMAQMSYEEIILARDAAMNAGNVDLTVSLYADDGIYAVIFGPGQDPLVLSGKQAIFDRLAPFAEGNVSYQATVLGVIGDTARAFTKWSFDGLRADGFAYLEQFEEFVFEDGKIVEHTSSVVNLVPLETAALAPFPMPFDAELGGDQVVPPVDTDASGHTTAMLIGDLLVVAGSYEGLSSDVYGQGFMSQPGIQIHHAAAGENGNTVRTDAEQFVPELRNLKMFSDGGTAGSFYGAFRLTTEQSQELEAGRFYLVVHTETQPFGELRGQLLPTTRLDLSSEDLVGLWENKFAPSTTPTYFQFNEDGTFIIGYLPETLEDYPAERGVYQLDGQLLTFTAEYANTVECTGATGTYTVMLSKDNQLRFFPHADECPHRLADLRGSLLLPVTH